MTLPSKPVKSLAELELCLLGSGEVRLKGLVLEVGHRKMLALLAYLALEGKTPRSLLTTLFWSDNSEEAARRNLRRELHRLRESGLRDHLEANSDTLGLIGLASTDVARFEAFVADGYLENALALYRNELLAGLRLENAPEFEAWLETRRENLANTLRRAQLELAERLETKGDWHAALGLHQKILRSDRLQERQHREVMRLHHLLGQREAAIAQFEQCKTMLQEELGLEPLPVTIQLVQQIRAAQTLAPNLVIQMVTSQQIVASLIGRETALKTLASSVTALTLVLGEAGIGKTFLLEQYAPKALRLRFRAISSQTPLYAVAEIIREALNTFEARVRFETLDPIWQHQAARLVPELGSGTQQLQERSLFLEGLARVLECLSPELLIFEDIHWADNTSLELFAHMVRRASRQTKPQRLIATARAEELSTETQSLLEAFKTDRLSTSLDLEPLSQNQVSELVSSLGGGSTTAFSKRLHALTDGNPFFMLETSRYLFEQGELEIQNETWVYTTTTLPIPPSVREAVLKRIDKTGSATRRLLETAALTMDGFTLETLQNATALNEWESLEGLEQAVSAQILRRLETGYGFTHEITRTTLQSALSTERKRLIHNKLAISLEQQKASPASIAIHLEQAGKAQAAIPWRIKAAEAAVQVYAHAQALEQYQKAIDDGATDLLACELLLEKLSIWEILGQPTAWQTDLEQLAWHSHKINDLATTNQLQLARVRFALHQRQFAEVQELTTSMTQSQTTPEIMARAYVYAGTALVQQSQFEAAKTYLTQALNLLPENHLLRAAVFQQLFQMALDRGDTQEAEQHLADALVLNQSHQNLLAELGNLNNQAKIALNKGQPETAINIFETALEKVKPINNPTLERTLTMGLATAYSRIHKLDDALKLLTRALELAKLTDSISAQGGIYHTIGAVHRRLTQFGLAVQHYQIALELADQIEHHPSRIFRRLTLADLYLDLGNQQKALPLLEETRSIIKATEVQAEAQWCQILLGKQQRLAGQIQAALSTLEMPEPSNPIDRIIWLTELALARLAAENFAGVLELLSGEDAPANTMSQLLGIRVQALAGLKQPNTQELSELTALESDLTPLFVLHYHTALARTYQLTKQSKLAKQHQALARAKALEMAAWLLDYPELQTSFLEQYAEVEHIRT